MALAFRQKPLKRIKLFHLRRFKVQCRLVGFTLEMVSPQP